MSVTISFTPRKVAKFLVALGGLAGSALSLGLVPTAEKPWVTLAVSAVTALTVYVTPNSTKQAPVPVPPA